MIVLLIFVERPDVFLVEIDNRHFTCLSDMYQNRV